MCVPTFLRHTKKPRATTRYKYNEHNVQCLDRLKKRACNAKTNGRGRHRWPSFVLRIFAGTVACRGDGGGWRGKTRGNGRDLSRVDRVPAEGAANLKIFFVLFPFITFFFPIFIWERFCIVLISLGNLSEVVRVFIYLFLVFSRQPLSSRVHVNSDVRKRKRKKRV